MAGGHEQYSVLGRQLKAVMSKLERSGMDAEELIAIASVAFFICIHCSVHGHGIGSVR